MSDLRPTPETDAAIISADGAWTFELKETMQRLERERDEARATCQELVTDSNAVTLAAVVRLETAIKTAIQRFGNLAANKSDTMEQSIVKPGTRWSIQFTSERCIEVHIDTVFEDRVRWRYKRSYHNETLQSFCSEPRCAVLLPPKPKPWWKIAWSGFLD